MPETEGGPAPGRWPSAPLLRRLPCLLYEALLLVAVAFLATAAAVALAHFSGHVPPRWLMQAYLVLVGAFYFVPQWRAGHTLPMRTWRIRLATAEGQPLTTARACLRYSFALVSALLCGAGFLWALLDRDRQFLHDRLGGTRLVILPRKIQEVVEKGGDAAF